MQLSLEQIERELAETESAPDRLADFRVFLAALYSWRAAEMQKILAIKPSAWLDIRSEKNSDRAADKEWQATEQGARETQIKWELKRVSTLSSAIATKLRVMSDEARNIM